MMVGVAQRRRRSAHACAAHVLDQGDAVLSESQSNRCKSDMDEVYGRKQGNGGTPAWSSPDAGHLESRLSRGGFFLSA